MSQRQFETRDFYLAAFLIASNETLVSYNKVSRITVFGFQDSDELRSKTGQYFSTAATVEPIRFSNAIRNLKTLLHSSILTDSNENSTCQTIQDQPVH